MNRAKIVGTGAAVPRKILTNADLERLVETSDQWITERTGIKERHIVVGRGEVLRSLHEGGRRSVEAGSHEGRGHRHDPRRDDFRRHAVPGDRVPRPEEPRRDEGGGVGRRGRLRRLPLRAAPGRRAHPVQQGGERPGHRRRDPVPVRGLDRPIDLRPLRRRRGRGRPAGHEGRPRDPRHADEVRRQLLRLHQHAGRRIELSRQRPALSGTEAVLHPDEGERDVQGRRQGDGGRDRRPAEGAGVQERGHQGLRPAPGQRADHRRRRDAAEIPGRPRLQERGPLREHFRRIDPHRAG